MLIEPLEIDEETTQKQGYVKPVNDKRGHLVLRSRIQNREPSKTKKYNQYKQRILYVLFTSVKAML